VIDRAFVAGYGTFAVVMWSVLLVALGWKLGERYLKPILCGVLFGLGTQFLFGVGIFGLILGGMLTGYMLAGLQIGGLSQLRGGSLTGLIMDASLLLAMGLYLVVKEPEVAGTFAQLCTLTAALLFRDLMLAGIGGMLGGALRKLMAPRPAAQT
jgi:hypothetical protein